MNFFEHQDSARRNTKLLVVLMLAAVASLIAITSALVFALGYGFQFTSDRQVQAYDTNQSVVDLASQTMNWQVFGFIALAVIVVVTLGSIFKLLQLSGGGRTVAETMGGRLLNINTSDRDEKKVLNVVEEMAIASGTLVPPVYLIDDDSINAFAAGFKAQDAVIGVTRGCIRLLDRDELQGVIAHEFSHILHGDMRLNIRLVGILNGILLIGLIGYFLMRSISYRSISSSKKGNNVAAMMFLALGLIVIGYGGTFFGNLIKAAVSRQREFLADASAVQFTRNPEGIGAALKKLGGYAQGSLLQAPRAAEFSHMYFGQGIKIHFLGSLMATHPPLRERIKRIQPNWDGKYSSASVAKNSETSSPRADAAPLQSELHSNFAQVAAAGIAGASATVAAAETPAVNASAVDSIGAPSQSHIDYARTLLAAIPSTLLDAAHDPFSARAVIYNLLLDRASEEVRQQQWNSLRQHAHPVVFNLTQKLTATMPQLERRCYLPLLDLCIPTLKNLSAPQYQIFKRNLVELIRADNKADLFEWSLYRIVVHNLDAGIKGITNASAHLIPLDRLGIECQQLFSVLAYSGTSSTQLTVDAYRSAMASLRLGHLPMLNAQSVQLPMLDQSLDKLRRLKPLQKPTLLKALATCITSDNHVSLAEAELFRAIADSLDCPVPPLLPGQKLN